MFIIDQNQLDSDNLSTNPYERRDLRNY